MSASLNILIIQTLTRKRAGLFGPTKVAKLKSRMRSMTSPSVHNLTNDSQFIAASPWAA